MKTSKHIKIIKSRKPVKVAPQVFPLTTTAGRVGLIAGITAGTVSRAEVEASVIHDTQPRQHRKPVVAEDIRYPSVSAAARAIVKAEFIGKRFTPDSYERRIASVRVTIANWCNADNVPGFYWSE